MLAPKLRFKEFATEWQQARLSELVLKITDGTHDTPIVQKQGIPFLTAINVKDGYIDYDNIGYVDEVTHKKIFERCNPEKDDLLIVNIGAGTATCARNIVDYPFSLKNVALIKPNINLLNPKFLEQIQRKNAKKLFSTLTSGGAQPFLSLKEIGKFVINYSSVEEQTKIASFLSAVDEKISQLTQKHALLSQYKQGMMQKLFSQQIRFKADDGSAFGEWEDLKICDLVRSLDAGVSVNSEDIKPTNDEYSVLKTSCISSGYFDENERKRVLLEEEINRLKEPVLDNSILMSRMNTPLLVGMNAYIEKAPKNTYLPDRLWQLKINADKVLTRWLAFYLGSENGLSQIRDLASGTSNSMKNIKKSDVLNLEIFVPSKEEQTKIANFLSAVDQKIEVVAQQIEQAKTWKKGLLQQMFV